MVSENFSNVISSIIAYIGIGLFLALVVGIVLLCGVLLLGKCRLFPKCGKQWWKAIIPFYGDYVFIVEICELHWAWFVALLLFDLSIIETNGATSIIKMFVMAMCFYNLAVKGNKDTVPAMIFGGIFTSIMYAVYGFGDYEYHKEIPVKSSGVF